MTTTSDTKFLPEDFGYNIGLEQLWFETHPELPNGKFVIQRRKGLPYWYYRLGSDGYSNTISCGISSSIRYS